MNKSIEFLNEIKLYSTFTKKILNLLKPKEKWYKKNLFWISENEKKIDDSVFSYFESEFIEDPEKCEIHLPSPSFILNHTKKEYICLDSIYPDSFFGCTINPLAVLTSDIKNHAWEHYFGNFYGRWKGDSISFEKEIEIPIEDNDTKEIFFNFKGTMIPKQTQLLGWDCEINKFEKIYIEELELLCQTKDIFSYDWKDIISRLEGFNDHLYLYDSITKRIFCLGMISSCGVIWTLLCPDGVIYSDLGGCDKNYKYSKYELKEMIGLPQYSTIVYKWKKFFPSMFPIIAAKTKQMPTFTSFYTKNNNADRWRTCFLIHKLRDICYKQKAENDLERKREKMLKKRKIEK